MLHDGGQGHCERFGQFADGDAVAPFKFGQQRAPRRIGDGGKHAVQAVGRIVNHVVKYRGARGDVKGRRQMGTAALFRGGGLDELYRVVAGPFGGACEGSDLASRAIDQHGCHAQLPGGVEVCGAVLDHDAGRPGCSQQPQHALIGQGRRLADQAQLLNADQASPTLLPQWGWGRASRQRNPPG